MLPFNYDDLPIGTVMFRVPLLPLSSFETVHATQGGIATLPHSEYLPVHDLDPSVPPLSVYSSNCLTSHGPRWSFRPHSRPL